MHEKKKKKRCHWHLLLNWACKYYTMPNGETAAGNKKYFAQLLAEDLLLFTDKFIITSYPFLLFPLISILDLFKI